MDDTEEDNDNRPFSPNINKRPHKKNKLNPIKHTGISKQVIPANQLENPTWDPDSRQWIEGIPPPVYEKEPKHPFTATSEIRGHVGTGIQYSRMVSNSRITPWRQVYVGDPNQSRPYWRQSRQPSHSRYSRYFKKRGGTHKRKNKHTRRRRL